ncbi:ROK family protein [Cellvibrio sp.]|uniref:ROK family transcriptional regulator n=1 Tax=Cellvibrio sp. TaxID=1965322 RepID=UPI0039647491
MSKGSNSSGLRRYNERVLINSIRKLGQASKLELARLSNLTPQAVTRIIDDLDAAGLVIQRGKVQRGLGQPSTMYSLNPSGAYSIGVNVGRSDIQLLLMDFVGTVVGKIAHEFETPNPDFLLDKIEQGIAYLESSLSSENKSRLVGVGLAMPWFMGAWKKEVNMDDALAERWATIKFDKEVAARTHLPVFIENDCSAAAIAELKFGNGLALDNFLYVFIGTFVGGGLVLKGNLESGVHGNAGALASMPVTPSLLSSAPPNPGKFETLANRASIFVLRRHLNANGFPIKNISELPDLMPAAKPFVDEWLDDCAEALTFSILSSLSVVDFEGVVIDGYLPRELVQALVTRVEQKVNQHCPQGVFLPQVHVGKIGPDARAIGGAILPLYINFSPDKNVMLTGADE